MNPILSYVLLTLCSLWSWQATEANTVHLRLVLCLVVLSLWTFAFQTHFRPMLAIVKSYKSEDILKAAPLSVGLILTGLALMLLTQSALGSTWFWGNFSAQSFLLTALFAFYSEFYFRKQFEPLWGSSNVAMLEALTLGVATLSLTTGLSILLWGLAYPKLSTRFEVKHFILGRIFGTLGILILGALL